jgi:hypothetical protein
MKKEDYPVITKDRKPGYKEIWGMKRSEALIKHMQDDMKAKGQEVNGGRKRDGTQGKDV